MDVVELVESKEMLFGFIVEKTAKKMKQSFSRILLDRKAGITVDQWVIIKILNDEDGISQFEIAKRSFKDAPTVTRILDLLGRKKLIQRIPGKLDRRKFEVHLTALGKSKVKEILPIAHEFRKSCYAGINPKDLGLIEELMNTIFNNLEKE